MSNNQQVSSGAVAGLLNEVCPFGITLSARHKLGFAFKTIGYRLPVILTKIIDQLSRDKNEIGGQLGEEARSEVKTVVGHLAKLKNEMITNKKVLEIGNSIWDDYLTLMAETYFEGVKEDVKYFFAPWLYIECYLYRRIHEAFQTTVHLQTLDIFRKQKEEAYFESVDQACILGEYAYPLLCDDDVTHKTLQTLLEVSLWGNKCDLSMAMSGEEVTQSSNLIEQLESLRKWILCDNSEQIWEIISEAVKNKDQTRLSIGFVLDNSAFELFTDFLLADALLTKVDHVNFYVKVLPWFVSDVRVHDFHWLLKTMASDSDRPIFQKLAERWKQNVESGKWSVVEEPFWTYPHGYHEMKKADPKLYEMLSKESFLVFKGDLNYRKLLGDYNWPHDTPFQESLRGFLPAPLVALRTMKADVVSGLPSGISIDLQSKDPEWMVKGDYGLIQVAK